MEENLLSQVYDRYKPRMDNPSVSVTVTGSGSSVYRYIVTALNETGETDGCSVVVTGAPDSLSYTQYITLSWNNVLYAKKYRVYGRIAGATFGLLTETTETTFIDYGVLTADSSKLPPDENTTGRYNWENIVFLPGRSLQSAELNEIQSVLYEKIKSLGGAFFQNGDIVAGCDITWTGNGVKISSGKVYAWGTVRDIDEGELAVPFFGTWYIGLNVRELYIDSNDDPILLDPAQGYPGYAQAGAARRLLYFYWTWAARKDDIDIPMWEVIDGNINPVRPVYEYSVLDRTIARKLHSLHGYVWVSGYTTRVSPDKYDRDKMLISITPGVAFVHGREIRKSGEVRLREDVAKDLSDEMLEEASAESGYLYPLSMSPVAVVSNVNIREKIAETRTVPNVYDSCSWHYDATGERVDEILGVWTNSSKTTPYTFSNTDPGCANRTYDVYLSNNGFALNPNTFDQGQTYYIEYLIYTEATKGVRSRAYQEDQFVFDPDDLTYQLSKKDGIKSDRSPVVVIDEDENVYLEGTHWTINMNKTSTTIGYPEITFLNSNVMPEGTVFYVKYYYWDHEVEGDYVTIDSYVDDTTSYDYDDVEYKNYVDFRTTSSLKPASENSDILVEYQIFLSQFAWLVLDDEGKFKLVRGVSSVQPARTRAPDGVLPLLCMYMPAFSQSPITMNTTRYQVARDYDVNILKERVEKLEYNLAATVIEQETLAKHTTQPKKGLFTDAFVDNLGMDTNACTCSIDSRKNRAFIHRNYESASVTVNESESQDISFWTNSATIEATETPIDYQLIWTEDFAKEVAGFLFARPQVVVECFPKVDIWYSDSTQTQVQMHTVEVPSLLALPTSVDPNTAKQLLSDWAKRDVSWILNDEHLNLQPGNLSLALTTSKQSNFSTISLSRVELIGSVRSRTIVLVIRGCYPYEDGITAKVDGVPVQLSIANASDLTSCGVRMSPTGSAGTLSGTVKADANGVITAKFTLPSTLTPGQKLIEVRSVADPRLSAIAYFFTQGMRREFLNTRTIVQTTEKLYIGSVQSRPSEEVTTEPPVTAGPVPPPPPPSCPMLSVALSNRQFQYTLNQALSIPVLINVKDATTSKWTGQISLSVETDVSGGTVSINPTSFTFNGGSQTVSATISHSAISSSGTYHIKVIAQANIGSQCGGNIILSDILTLTLQPVTQPEPRCPAFYMTGSPGHFVVEKDKSVTVPIRLTIRDTNSSRWSGNITLQVTTEVPGGTVSIYPSTLQFTSDSSVQEFEASITHSAISDTNTYTISVNAQANVGTNCGGTQTFGHHRLVLDVRGTVSVIRCPRLIPSLSPNSIRVNVNENINLVTNLTVYDAAKSGWTGTVNLSISGQSGSVVPNSFNFTGSSTVTQLTISIPAFSSEGRRVASLVLTPVGLDSSCTETQVGVPVVIRVRKPSTPSVEPSEPSGTDFTYPPDALVSVGDGGGGGDPLCQTFTLKEPRVVSSIDLWFHRVSNQDAPVEVGIRPLTDSGIPDKRQHITRTSLSRNQIMQAMGITDPSQTVSIPTLSNRVTFSFPDPVYLPPGDYGFYVGTNVPGYFVFCARLGKTILGSLSVSDSSRIGVPLSVQAHDGVLFSSSNNISWQVELENDLMFRINGLDTGSNDHGRVVLSVDNPPTFHEFALLAHAVVPSETSLKGMYSVNSSGWTEFGVTLIDDDNSTHDFVNVGRVGTSLKLAIDLYTRNTKLTPILRLDPIQVVCLTYDNESVYQTKELEFGGQTFENIEGWVDTLLNNGTISISASFDSGTTWYSVPTIGTVPLSDGFSERNFGGSISTITSGSLSEADSVILRITMTSNSSSRWASPQIKRLRFLVY